MQDVTISSSFFEENRIKALCLQKEGETALLLWMKLFFSSVYADTGGKLILFGDVPHDEKSIAALYGLPVKTAESALKLLIRYGLLTTENNQFSISGFAELASAARKEKHRQSQRRYAQRKQRIEAEPGVPQVLRHPARRG